MRALPGMVALALLLTACTAELDSRPQSSRYADWLARGGGLAPMLGYRDYLIQHGVGDVLPMPQLLTSARRWRLCRAPEFAVPPQSQWPAMVRTLRLVDELHRERLLPDATVASAYRNAELNDCEGGSSRSRHVANAALDFDLSPDPALTARLCSYWRRNGARHGFGLGFYQPGKIHVDTSGFRTWGRTFKRDSSLCVAAQAQGGGTTASRAHTPK